MIPDHVEHPDAWLAGREAAIRRNARKGRRERFERDYPELARHLGWYGTHGSLRQRADGCYDADGELVDYDKANIDRHALRIVRKMPQWIWDALDEWGGLTEKQAAVAQKIIDRETERAGQLDAAEAERRANATPWTGEREERTGRFVYARREETMGNPYSRYPSYTYKGIFMADDGAKLWVTVPSALREACAESLQNWDWDEADLVGWLKRTTITLRATTKPKDEDPTFAFGSRPHLVEVISTEEAE